LNDLKSLREGITIRRSTFKIKQLFETWQAVPQFQQATIRLDIRNGEQEFYGDEQKIRSFINELVENAVKHNPDQPDLQIDIASYDELNPLIPDQTIPHNQLYLVIQVRDNGKGVPPNKKDLILLPLTSTAKQGSGLGLAIIHRTVHKMDGYITETGANGADFHIYIPYHKETL
jgi:signal transduction histidine kinase